ncbi:hypothetical protein [Micromonospora wenchangensis]|uniref:hypothetical protein n=1 Tax=Micromonospora wenchangensis TaxID=1185415 RepID=UPI003429999C
MQVTTGYRETSEHPTLVTPMPHSRAAVRIARDGDPEGLVVTLVSVCRGRLAGCLGPVILAARPEPIFSFTGLQPAQLRTPV